MYVGKLLTGLRLARRWLVLRRYRRRYRARRRQPRDRIRALASGPDTTVCFLCYGNICRSPFAARYFADSTRCSATTVSTGFIERTGRESPPAAVEAASKLDVDLGSHRSSSLDEATVRTAEVILAMDYGNCYDFERRYPDHVGKCFLLTDVFGPGSDQIADPYGDGMATFEATYRRIAAALDELETLLDC